MTEKLKKIQGKTLVADVVGDNYITWHVEHPYNGCTYDLTYHKDSKDWSVELGQYDEDKDDWVFTTIAEGLPDPANLLKECKIARLVA